MGMPSQKPYEPPRPHRKLREAACFECKGPTTPVMFVNVNGNAVCSGCFGSRDVFGVEAVGAVPLEEEDLDDA